MKMCIFWVLTDVFVIIRNLHFHIIDPGPVPAGVTGPVFWNFGNGSRHLRFNNLNAIYMMQCNIHNSMQNSGIVNQSKPLRLFDCRCSIDTFLAKIEPSWAWNLCLKVAVLKTNFCLPIKARRSRQLSLGLPWLLKTFTCPWTVM